MRTCRTRSCFGNSTKLDLKYETTTDAVQAHGNINLFSESRFRTVTSIACVLQSLNFHVEE